MEPMEEDQLPVTDKGIVYGEISRNNNADMLEAGIQAGNIYRQTADAEVMDLPEASNQQRAEDYEKIRQIELERTMKNLVVPVMDTEVRALLRQLGEPITLFGEREMERRKRLRTILATMTEETARSFAATQQQLQEQGQEILLAQPPSKEIFYTEGPEALKTARLEIAQYSLRRARARILVEKENRIIEEQQHYEKKQNKGSAMDADSPTTMEQRVGVLANQSSEIAGERPVVACRFARDGSFLATGSWSGTVHIWSIDQQTFSTTVHRKIAAHDDRITGIDCHPNATAETKASPSSTSIGFATGAADSTAKLWTLDGALLKTLYGHTDRLGRIAFHPMGRHLATASFDATWRFWDVETGECLTEQEGHSSAVYTVAFQNDGALAVSGGLDGYGRVWDIRTGKNIMLLEGHVKGVLSVDFSPNGFYIATGSLDHSARVYDLRKRGSLAILPGHNSLISQVRFAPQHGEYLLTSGFDGVSKVWCGRKFALTKKLAGHEGKVMGSDISPADECLIASVGYDRTLKMWHPDEHLLQL